MKKLLKEYLKGTYNIKVSISIIKYSILPSKIRIVYGLGRKTNIQEEYIHYTQLLTFMSKRIHTLEEKLSVIYEELKI